VTIPHTVQACHTQGRRRPGFLQQESMPTCLITSIVLPQNVTQMHGFSGSSEIIPLESGTMTDMRVAPQLVTLMEKSPFLFLSLYTPTVFFAASVPPANARHNRSKEQASSAALAIGQHC
jgi:hypothetical protein